MILDWLLQPVTLAGVFIVYTLALVALLVINRKLRKAKGKAVAESKTSQTEESSLTNIASSAEHAKQLNKTFRKFVPKQFVDHLTKHGASGLKLGKADEDELAILFTDIRGFTSLSEQMNPQELMNFLNSYFLRMNDPIHQNNGFIDKFIGDAVMALFDRPTGSNQDKAQDAIRAALGLRQAINLYNLHRANCDYPPINIGIGVHFGPVIIGTVGSNDRMDTTVIGDSVNIAYRLEALAPIYQADIVVSAQTLKTAGAEGVFNARILDWVKVKGRQTAIEIYEILDHLPADIQQQKQACAGLIQQGIQHRTQGQLQQAKDCFTQATLISPNDSLAHLHLQQLQGYATANTQDWDGAIAHHS